MKEYTKQFENVYQSAGRFARLNSDTAVYLNPLTKESFKDYYQKSLRDFYNSIWMATVRSLWLADHYSKEGFRHNAGSALRNSFNPNKERGATVKDFTSNVYCSFTNYPRLVLGSDRTPLVETFSYRHLLAYVEDFFPKEEFLANNPFENPDFYKIPFKHISVEFMLPVYQMQERMDLLKIAEDRSMTWDAFMDYLINYINCYNQEAGKMVYSMVRRHPLPDYVRDNRYSIKIWKKITRKGNQGIGFNGSLPVVE